MATTTIRLYFDSGNQLQSAFHVSSLQMMVILDDAPVKTCRTQTSPTKTRDLPRTRDVVETLRSRSTYRDSRTRGKRRSLRGHRLEGERVTASRRDTNHCWAHLNCAVNHTYDVCQFKRSVFNLRESKFVVKLNKYKTVKVCNYKDFTNKSCLSAVVWFHTHQNPELNLCSCFISVQNDASGIFYCLYDKLSLNPTCYSQHTSNRIIKL